MNKESRYELQDWKNIKSDFDGATLILGNGTSIAVDECFKLFKLKEVAESNQWIDENLNKIFRKFDTHNEGNFELILQFVWHAKLVNDCLGVDNEIIAEAYDSIKNALIKSVREGHCDYFTAKKYFKKFIILSIFSITLFL